MPAEPDDLGTGRHAEWRTQSGAPCSVRDMRLSTMTKTLRNGRARLLLRLLGLADQVYRAEFLAAASRAGMLRELGGGPLSLGQLMNELGIPGARSDEFRAWLRLGERLGEISVEAGSVRLKGLLARALVDP